MSNVKVKEGLEGIELFGDVDKVNGKVGSEYPAYYFDQQCEELSDSERKLQSQLDNGLIPDKGKPAAVAELKKVRGKLEAIESSRPDVERYKDTLADVASGLTKKIVAVMPTRTEMKLGHVDAHEEYRKDNTEFCVELESDELMLAKKLHCRCHGNKVTRNSAVRLWKICRKLTEQNPDVEVIRRA